MLLFVLVMLARRRREEGNDRRRCLAGRGARRCAVEARHQRGEFVEPGEGLAMEGVEHLQTVQRRGRLAPLAIAVFELMVASSGKQLGLSTPSRRAPARVDSA
jgi:hypothetical protein